MTRSSGMRRALAAGGLAALMSVCASRPGPVTAAPADQRLERLAGAYLDRWLERRPDAASRLGIHAADGRLVPVTEATLEEDAAWLRDLRARLGDVLPDALGPAAAADRDVLDARLAADLLALEIERTFRTDPNAYVALIGDPIASLLRRDHVPLCHRLRAIARRLERVPEVMRSARVNLERPARLRTETAIARFEAVLRLYREDVPAAARACRDPRTQAMIAEADSAAAVATAAFVDFLRTDLLPRSDGPLALGEAVLSARLATREMEDAPLDSLLARARRELDAMDARLEALAARIAPGLGVRAALEGLGRPAPDSLVPAVRAASDAARAFAVARGLIAAPRRLAVETRPAPLGSRFRPPVAIDAPLVWERAHYPVRLDVAGGSGADAGMDDHRVGPGIEGATLAAIHEGLTGHLAQSLAWRRADSRLRQALQARSTVEGWACYGERLMLEEGFRSGDAAFELAACQRAAIVLGRVLAGISMHARGMGADEAARFLADRCHLTAGDAEREARILAVDPSGVADAPGMWRILALRDEVRGALGARFDLRAFHEAFLRHGAAPVPVIRRLVLRDFGLDSGARPLTPTRGAG